MQIGHDFDLLGVDQPQSDWVVAESQGVAYQAASGDT
jgi:hypothetical protein